MVHIAMGLALTLTQLVAPGGGLPQVVEASYSSDTIVAGKASDIVLSLNVRDGYKINHTPPMQLKLEPVPGITMDETNFVSDPLDPASTDEYYVNVPDFKFQVEAARAGVYEVSGELVYFFCSIADGFCARQTLDVQVPLTAE